MLKTHLRPGDFIIVVLALIVSLVLIGKVFLPGKTASVAEIVSDGEIIATIDLSTGRVESDLESSSVNGVTEISFVSSGYHLTIECRDGRVRFKDSDCPDRVCVNTGFISLSGQIAACVPAGILIRVTGGSSESEPDIIIG